MTDLKQKFIENIKLGRDHDFRPSDIDNKTTNKIITQLKTAVRLPSEDSRIINLSKIVCEVLDDETQTTTDPYRDPRPRRYNDLAMYVKSACLALEQYTELFRRLKTRNVLKQNADKYITEIENSYSPNKIMFFDFIGEGETLLYFNWHDFAKSAINNTLN